MCSYIYPPCFSKFQPVNADNMQQLINFIILATIEVKISNCIHIFISILSLEGACRSFLDTNIVNIIFNLENIYSLLHSFTPSLLHSFTPSLLHSFTPSLLHSFTPSLLHSFTPSLLHSFTPSLLHSFTPSLLHSFTPSLLHSFTPSHFHFPLDIWKPRRREVPI